MFQFHSILFCNVRLNFITYNLSGQAETGAGRGRQGRAGTGRDRQRQEKAGKSRQGQGQGQSGLGQCKDVQGLTKLWAGVESG